jgi:N-glycosidase YbiA
VEHSMTAISLFDGEYHFLSNFYRREVVFDHRSYPTAEHAYQAAKCDDSGDARRIALLRSPGRAKRAGATVTMRPGWNLIRIEVMGDVLAAKFADEELAARLVATGDRLLEEGNTWGDTFWGVCDGEGENWLGRLLMQRRAVLQQL